MPQRRWTSKQLRSMPELRRFDRDDPLVARWIRIGSIGWAFQNLAGWIAVATWFALWWFLILGLIAIAWGHVSEGTLAIILLGVVVAACVGAPIAHGFGAFWVFRVKQRKLRTELRRRGIPICIRCGYEGGDIAAPRCPECGTPAP